MIPMSQSASGGPLAIGVIMQEPTLFPVARRQGFQFNVRPAEYRGQYHMRVVTLGAGLEDHAVADYGSLSLHELVDVVLAKLDAIDGY